MGLEIDSGEIPADVNYRIADECAQCYHIDLTRWGLVTRDLHAGSFCNKHKCFVNASHICDNFVDCARGAMEGVKK